MPQFEQLPLPFEGAVLNAWRATAQDFSNAITEASAELGDEDFTRQVASQLETSEPWPTAETLELVEARYPEAREAILERFQAIGEARREREKADLKREAGGPMRKLGRSALRGAQSFVLSPILARKDTAETRRS